MPYASSIMGEYVNISTSQSDTAAISTGIRVFASTSIFNIELSTHRMTDYSYWYILPFFLPLSLYLFLLKISSAIKAENIIFGITNDLVFKDFEKKGAPNAFSKGLDGRTIYISQELQMAKT